MFEKNYNFFGVELDCQVLTFSSTFHKESDAYAYLKKISTAAGYKYTRIETVNQIGFPDIILLKGERYFLIEAKRLDKKNLTSLEDDLKWQFGQIAFAVRSVTLELSYALVVCKDNKLAIIGQEQTLCRLKNSLHY